MSPNPQKSFIDSRQLLLWLMVPVVARFARGHRAEVVINVIIALGAAGAVVGVVQFAMFGFDDLQKRPTGALSHYMTYSGVLMLVTGRGRGPAAVPSWRMDLAGDCRPGAARRPCLHVRAQRLGRRVRRRRVSPGHSQLAAGDHRSPRRRAVPGDRTRRNPPARVLDVRLERSDQPRQARHVESRRRHDSGSPAVWRRSGDDRKSVHAGTGRQMP